MAKATITAKWSSLLNQIRTLPKIFVSLAAGPNLASIGPAPYNASRTAS